MIGLRPTRNEWTEMLVLTAVAATIWLGLRWQVLTRDHMMFIAGNGTMYLVWCVAATWRERAKRQQGMP